MSAAERVYRAEFRSGARAELTLSRDGARCEWLPEFPSALRGQRRRKFLQSYRAWRDECLRDFAARTGLRIMVLEL